MTIRVTSGRRAISTTEKAEWFLELLWMLWKKEKLLTFVRKLSIPNLFLKFKK